MHGARKVIPVLFAILIVGNCGCSVFLKGVRGDSTGEFSAGSAIVYSQILENNILPGGVYISKAGVELHTGSVRDRFTANIRISPSGEFLASIRAFAGLEIGRVFATKDEVIVLDRLGRTATIYKWTKLRDEFGFVYEMIPLVFGDVPAMRTGERRRLECGNSSVFETGWASLDIIPECNVNKASRMILSQRGTDREVVLRLSDFKNSGETVYPARVEASEKTNAFHVKLSVDAIEVPWKGSINFEIPAGYRIIR